MAAPIVVPDASVVLKWILPSTDEPDADRAIALRDAIAGEAVRALLPALWLYEVGNTLARRFPAHAEPWLAVLMKFELEEAVPSSTWLTEALRLTRTYGVTFYDAAYHATAVVHRGVFVTADSRYVDRARLAGSIILLSEWSPP